MLMAQMKWAQAATTAGNITQQRSTPRGGRKMKKMTAENRNERVHAFTQAVNRRKLSILLAEDDVEMRRLLAWSLERAGYHVIECPDGMTLMRKLGYLDAHGSIQPADLVVSDIRMPGFTGMEVLQSAHDFGDALPIILVSAFADEAAYEQAERLGAAALLAKPFDVEELIEKIGETLEHEPVAGAESEFAPDDANLALSPRDHVPARRGAHGQCAHQGLRAQDGFQARQVRHSDTTLPRGDRFAARGFAGQTRAPGEAGAHSAAQADRRRMQHGQFRQQ
jgi:CheY-like chemotaxis protein